MASADLSEVSSQLRGQANKVCVQPPMRSQFLFGPAYFQVIFLDQNIIEKVQSHNKTEKDFLDRTVFVPQSSFCSLVNIHHRNNMKGLVSISCDDYCYFVVIAFSLNVLTVF